MAKTKPTLEDYIFDMETRPPDHGDERDLWSQLQKKESDLLLAAELGKALLDKNEELSKQQEKIIDDYSKKVEVSRFLFIFLEKKSFFFLVKLGNFTAKAVFRGTEVVSREHFIVTDDKIIL